MASYNLRTPIIKPRQQGGTFYTFGSAMEDIGLNINSGNNIVELSHYVLLNLPAFAASSDSSDVWSLGTKGTYSKQTGDYVFAEAFQDYVLNMEAVLRNQKNYNYAAYRTVSERVFWKWLQKSSKFSLVEKTQNNLTYFVESDLSKSIVKGFGLISAGSQRSDDGGIYNETFAQIPSSYGQMRVLWKVNADSNLYYSPNKTYSGTNSQIIEGVASDEYDSNFALYSTGISAKGLFDSESFYSYSATDTTGKSCLEVEFDINNLRQFYDNNSTLTIDDIGYGENTINGIPESNIMNDFSFNAILVYYSIYDSTGQTCLATNAYGLYVLDGAIEGSSSTFSFPSLSKKKSTAKVDGTSFSFRLNIKPSSAYSGDVIVLDNATGAYSMSTDFTDVVQNLTTATRVLQSNSQLLYKIANKNSEIKELATNAIEQVNTLSTTVNNLIEHSKDTMYVNSLYQKNGEGTTSLQEIANNIFESTTVKYDKTTGDISYDIDESQLTTASKAFYDKMKTTKDGETYYDTTKLIALALSYVRTYPEKDLSYEYTE